MCNFRVGQRQFAGTTQVGGAGGQFDRQFIKGNHFACHGYSTIGQDIQIGRRLESADSTGLDTKAHRIFPSGGNPLTATNNAQNRAECCAGAVGIIAAIDRQANAPAEIAFPIKPAQNHIADITGCLKPAGRFGGLDYLGAGSPPVFFGKVGFLSRFDGIGHLTIFRDHRQTDRNQLVAVRLNKRGTFNRCDKNSRQGAFRLTMVNAGILTRHTSRQAGTTGCQTGPDFRPDPGPVAVLPAFIIKSA